MKIFTYWEGPRPEYLDLCRETLYRKCSLDIVELTPENVDKWFGPLPNIPINLKVDWLKANLIYKYGGFWLDADMVVVKDLAELVPYLDKGFCGIPGFFGAHKNDPLLKAWIDGMEEKLDDDLSFSDLIQPLLTHPDFKEFEHFTREMICPIYHEGSGENGFWSFFGERPASEFITDNTYIVTLYNSAFSDEFKLLTTDQILGKQWTISNIFRHALS